MSYPTDRKYTRTHEWFRPDNGTVTIGITQFAVDELTDITYVELPEVGTTVVAGGTVGEVESVKATSELFSAISGTVTEVNTDLADNPGLLNEDPLEGGWILKLKVDSIEPLEALMDAAAYQKSID
ncbi:MAG: glycine cleavage system protein GcvH [Planctomycetes bacterium]|nr:glycine cleavage system protein GcvH [Planctomycetota bacterium]